MAGAIRRVPAIADAGVTRMINGPEAFTPGQRVHPRRERGPRLLRRRRVLRPRDRRRRRDRPPGGELDRRRRARARPLEDGHPPVRRPVLAVARVDAGPDDRGLRDLLRHPLPERGAPGRPAAPDGADVRPARRARRRLRREVRLGAPELVRAERDDRARRARRSRRSGRAAGPASTGARRSGPRRWRRGPAAGLFDETSFAKIEVVGPGACAFLERMARTTSTCRSARSSTPRCSTAAAASSAT